MKQPVKTKCDYCDKLSLCEDNGFDNMICESCHDAERDRINEHHKSVGLSCYCSYCM